MVDNDFDLIVVGTGFASSFFLYSYLKKTNPSARILILERGPNEDFDTQLEMRAGSSLDHQSLYKNNHPHKRWNFSPGFGGYPAPNQTFRQVFEASGRMSEDAAQGDG